MVSIVRRTERINANIIATNENPYAAIYPTNGIQDIAEIIGLKSNHIPIQRRNHPSALYIVVEELFESSSALKISSLVAG